MSLYKTDRGYEFDIRRTGFRRLKLSLGDIPKRQAQAQYDAVLGLFRAKLTGQIERLRKGEITAAQLAEAVKVEAPLSLVGVDASSGFAWPTVQAAVDEYLAWLESNPNKAKSTATVARTRLKRFLSSVDPTRTVDTITAGEIEAYQATLMQEGFAINTVTQYVARVGTLFHWLRRQEERRARDEKREAHLLHVPLDYEVISTARTRRERFLSEKEAEQLLAATPPQLLAMVGGGLFAGLREGEASRLRPRLDVNLERGVLMIQVQPDWRPKTARAVRVVPIAAPLRTILERHQAAYASDEWLTPSIGDPRQPFNVHTYNERFTRIVKDAGLIPGRKDPRGVTPHTLRHTFASWLAMRKVDLYTIAQLLGDTLEQVEQTYAHLSPDFRQGAVDRLSDAVRLPELVGAATSPNATTGGTPTASATRHHPAASAETEPDANPS